MDQAIKIGLLKDEYLLLQKFYEDFDGRVVTIKGWSATIGIAAIGAGFYQSRFLWLFAAGAALVFWLIEATWKSFQYLYSPRIQELERAFREDRFDDVAPFQIYDAWFQALRVHRFQIFRIGCLPIVFFPHLLTVVVGIGIFVLNAYGLFT